MKKETHKTKQHTAKHHKSHKKVFDVVPPGKAPASATSRPVIVGHKPPVADDQFVPGAPPLRAADPSEEHELLDSKEKKHLEPTSPSAGSADKPAKHEYSAAIPPLTQAKNDKPTPTTPATASAPIVSEPTTPMSSEAPLSAETSVKDKNTPPPTHNRQGRTEEEELQEERPFGHLAVEQLVETDGLDTPEAPTPVNPTSVADGPPQATGANPNIQPKTIDDLLAETGAPSLEPTTAPTSIIISHHASRASIWEPVLIFLVIIVLAAAVLNFLLDADIIKTTWSLPHTDVL